MVSQLSAARAMGKRKGQKLSKGLSSVAGTCLPAAQNVPVNQNLNAPITTTAASSIRITTPSVDSNESLGNSGAMRRTIEVLDQEHSVPLEKKRKNKKKKAKSHRKQIPKRLREKVWQYYLGNQFEVPCTVPWCGNIITPFQFHVGHNIPKSFDGRMNLENLRPICSSCNMSMSNNFTIDQWDKYLILGTRQENSVDNEDNEDNNSNSADTRDQDMDIDSDSRLLRSGKRIRTCNSHSNREDSEESECDSSEHDYSDGTRRQSFIWSSLARAPGYLWRYFRITY